MAEKDVNNEIYKILARGKPSEEKVAKNPKLKEDWDKAQQLIKDNWKDGVPDKFMAKAFPKYDTKVTLGYYDAKQAKKLANIVAGLKEFDENNPDDKMLDKFINADNTPNGNTPATYIANHAIAMQKMLDNDEHKNDEDIAKMQSFLQAQQETLQMLADNGADFSKTDNNNQNVEEVAKIGQPKGKYSPALDQFIAKASADGEKHQDKVVVEEKQKALNVKEQGQTNIGNTQALAPNEQQKQQPQPELEGDVKPEDQEHGSGSEDYKGPAIKEKDIIDYLYNDVFIYYLNMLADKIIGYVKGKADRFAEYTRAESAKARKSESDLRKKQCDVAREKCVGLFQRTAPELTAEMERVQLGRSQNLRMLNSELRENIVHRRPIAQWAFPSMQQRQQQMQQQMGAADASDEQRQAAQAQYVAEVTADRHITEHFKQLYTQDPENCMRQLELAEKNLDKYLELDNAFGKMAVQRVMIKKANSYMDKSGFEWVNDKDLNMNDPKARAKLIKAAEAEKQEMWQRYALVTQLALDRAKLENLNETQTAQTVAQYQENFMDLEVKMAQKAFDMTLDDVSHDRFNAAAKFVDEKVQGMDKKEAKEYRAKFVRTAKDYVKNMDSYQGLADDLAARLEMKTADGQTTDLRSFTQKILQTEATQRAFMEDYQRGLSVMQAAQEQNNDRKAEIGKFKKGLLAPSAKNHMFAEVYTPKKRGSERNG